MAEREKVTVNDAVSRPFQRDGSAAWRELEAAAAVVQAGDARLSIKKLSVDEWWPVPARSRTPSIWRAEGLP